MLDETINRTPYIFIDITDVIHLKVQAEAAINTQYRGQSARKKHECMEGYWGIQVQVPYCEVFTPLYPEVNSFLPLGDWLYERARMSYLDINKNMSKIII